MQGCPGGFGVSAFVAFDAADVDAGAAGGSLLGEAGVVAGTDQGLGIDVNALAGLGPVGIVREELGVGPELFWVELVEGGEGGECLAARLVSACFPVPYGLGGDSDVDANCLLGEAHVPACFAEFLAEIGECGLSGGGCYGSSAGLHEQGVLWFFSMDWGGLVGDYVEMVSLKCGVGIAEKENPRQRSAHAGLLAGGSRVSANFEAKAIL